MWIARDQDDSLHMFRGEPKKHPRKGYWDYDENGGWRLNSDFYKDVKWADKKPVKLFECGDMEKVLHESFAYVLKEYLLYNSSPTLKETEPSVHVKAFIKDLIFQMVAHEDCKLSEIDGYEELCKEFGIR